MNSRENQRDELRKKFQDRQQHENASVKVTLPKISSEKSISKYFAVTNKGEIAVKLKLFKRDGRKITLPYSHQPVIDFTPEKGILIDTMQTKVVIRGRDMQKIEPYLTDDRVLWIKESSASFDDREDDVYVSEIEFEFK